jgi:hypothetical protein
MRAYVVNVGQSLREVLVMSRLRQDDKVPSCA